MRPVSHKQDSQIGPVAEDDEAAEATTEEADSCCDCQNWPAAFSIVVKVEPEADKRKTQDNCQQEEDWQRESTFSVRSYNLTGVKISPMAEQSYWSHNILSNNCVNY